MHDFIPDVKGAHDPLNVHHHILVTGLFTHGGSWCCGIHREGGFGLRDYKRTCLVRLQVFLLP